MTDGPRLSCLKGLRAGARLPGYAPENHGVGIVHIGIGAFHRAHQAVYTDDALASDGGDWRILGVSLRGTSVADALNPQNGLYTLIERGPSGTKARIIASIAGVIAASQDRKAVLAALCAPSTRIVSLTVTEKAYGIERKSGAVDLAHPAIARDLAKPQEPVGALGYIVEGLRLRQSAGLPAFTVLCCDNLPENGKLLRAGLLDFANRLSPALAGWIEANASFPSTMVDRITPASTEKTFADATSLIGCADLAAIETEPFCQWVIEDDFVAGRPHWEAGGAILVSDVAPYENMKLRMLNGSHSMIAYAGFLSGKKYVRDAMSDPALSRLVARHLEAAAKTLKPLSGIDLAAYAQDLAERFSNPEIAHETYQIAMDGTEKLPQRLLIPATFALESGEAIRPFAFAVAAWMRYALGRSEDGIAYALRDPREDTIAASLKATGNTAGAISDALHDIDGLFPDALKTSVKWRSSVETILAAILAKGMRQAIAEETAVI